MSRRSLTPSLVRTALGASAFAGFASPVTAQAATVPHWSTCFGGTGLEFGQGICRGPGNLVTVVGTTMSAGLATAGSYQPTYGGNGDGFVARFDPSRPAGQQLLWCSYFGGTDLEIVFDVEVDAAGNVIFAGCTHSPTLSVNGPGDGFVVRLDSSGTNLLNLVLVGGTNYDRITDITLLPGGAIACVGVTEPSGLPGLPNALNAYLGGTSDGFVGAIDLATSTVTWTRHLGGPTFDGYTMVSYIQNGGITSVWPGNLKRQAITTLPSGRIGLVTIANASAMTVAGVHPTVHQSWVQGGSDVYYVELSPAGLVDHATLIGGSSGDVPKDLAPHPAGGVVITGATFSSDLSTTTSAFQTTFAGNPNDAFVLHFDPSLATGQVRYGSFVGGDGGEDLFTRVAVESSGIVTLAGTGYGGGTIEFPTTHGALLTGAPATERCGAIVRMRLDGTGPGDLAYGTLIGQAWTVLHGLVLDDVGDACVIGGTTDTGYPTQTPHQPSHGGFVDATITHIPLLPGGTNRQAVGAATPACAQRLYASALGAPRAPNPRYTLCATNAPPNGIGVLAFGVPAPATPFLNVQVLVAPSVVVGVTTNVLGFSAWPLPIPASLAPGFQTWTQWAFLTTPACPGSGPLATTERLQLTTF